MEWHFYNFNYNFSGHSSNARSCELVESLLGLSYFEVISPFVLLFLPEVKCIVGFLAVPSQVTADAYLIKLAEQRHFREMENLAACELKIGTILKWWLMTFSKSVRMPRPQSKHIRHVSTVEFLVNRRGRNFTETAPLFLMVMSPLQGKDPSMTSQVSINA